MSKLSILMEEYGSGKSSLSNTVASLLSHDWVMPSRYKPSAEPLPAVVEGSWEEIENALNTGVISFVQYRALSNAYDKATDRHIPIAI
ncbi:MAG: hypothetical protein H9W81_04285 [Enterococcus sp.]|nr:hypothetical protein [Enterococcus sp.]